MRNFRPLTACEILDHEGQSIDSFYLERRFWVPIDDLPDHVWQAFVAAEDQHFFEHHGMDVLGLTRAFIANQRAGGSVQGGSTLTQQLVKNLLLTPEKTYERKLKEIILAWRMERELTKREILQLYLNFVFLGTGNYGIEAAARDYYGVSARELDVGEAALIAGLVPAPSRYSPRRNAELARWRRSLVLGRMMDEGWVDPVDVIDYEEAPILRNERKLGEDRGDSTAYVTSVRREIRRLFGPDEPFARGLTVTTPYDAKVQAVAVAATDKIATDHLKRQGPRAVVDRDYAGKPPPDPDDIADVCFVTMVSWNRNLGELRTSGKKWSLDPKQRNYLVFDEREAHARPLSYQLSGGELLGVCRVGTTDEVTLDIRPWAQAAAVAVENATGRIVAVTGGNDVTLEGFVRGTQARRQPGSSFKPYVYGAALAAGHTQMDRFLDGPISLPAGNGTMWSPHNYSGGYSGMVTMRNAIARSLNTVSVRLILEVGPTEVARIARGLGVKTPLRTDLTLALGSSEVTPLDQAMGYTGIARLGVPVDARWIDQVEDGDGNLLGVAGGKMKLDNGTEVELPGAPGVRVLEPEVAYQLVDLMRNVVTNGTGKKADVEGYARAGKTGTTSNFVDAWFCGYTPLYTVIVWTGTDGTGTLGDKETGGKASLPAWISIIEALPDQKGIEFPVPDEAVRVSTAEGLLGFARGHVPSQILRTGSAGAGPLPPLPE
ncbi:MAG: PBP1A family penicillin-binding protein [Myxococcota bacterium]